MTDAMSEKMRRRHEAACRDLAQALHQIGQPIMRDAAARGHYSDFGSQLVAPKMTLAADLEKIGDDGALALRRRVLHGDFDG